MLWKTSNILIFLTIACWLAVCTISTKSIIANTSIVTTLVPFASCIFMTTYDNNYSVQSHDLHNMIVEYTTVFTKSYKLLTMCWVICKTFMTNFIATYCDAVVTQHQPNSGDHKKVAYSCEWTYEMYHPIATIQ